MFYTKISFFVLMKVLIDKHNKILSFVTFYSGIISYLNKDDVALIFSDNFLIIENGIIIDNRLYLEISI